MFQLVVHHCLRCPAHWPVTGCSIADAPVADGVQIVSWGPIYKISYDLSYDYRKFIVRSTYDGDISLRNIVSLFTNTISDDITILHVNLTYEKLSIHCKMFCKLDVRRKFIVTLALSWDNRKIVVR